MADHTNCVLAIVGSRQVPNYQSESLVKQAILEHNPRIVVSGGARGVDTMARKMAQELKVSFVQFRPMVQTWTVPSNQEATETVEDWGLDVLVPGGFKERNMKVAQSCECLVRIASSQTTTYGSGWTADFAEAIGRRVYRHTV